MFSSYIFCRISFLGSPVQCRPSPSPVPEGLSEDHCNCGDIEYENPETRANLSRASRCPIHIRLRENCRNGRSLQQMLEVTFFKLLNILYVCTLLFLFFLIRNGT